MQPQEKRAIVHGIQPRAGLIHHGVGAQKPPQRIKRSHRTSHALAIAKIEFIISRTQRAEYPAGFLDYAIDAAAEAQGGIFNGIDQWPDLGVEGVAKHIEGFVISELSR